jgi:Leucine-rich repeat (LRR) protein
MFYELIQIYSICCRLLLFIVIKRSAIFSTNYNFEDCMITDNLISCTRTRNERLAFPQHINLTTSTTNGIDLVISRKSFVSLPDNILKGGDFNTLSLNRNSIQEIDPNAFDSIKFIESLFLRDNQISNLSFLLTHYNDSARSCSAHSVFRNITTLDLSINQLEYINQSYFVCFSSLITLLLVRNKLIMIDFGFFEGLENLQSINFQKNAIEEIANHKNKSNLLNLQELNLMSNYIENIENFAFLEMKNLKILQISANNITKLKPYSLKDLYNVQELYLIGNKLTLDETDENIFNDLQSLKTLDLSFNNMSSIKQGKFLPLVNLVRLMLSNNTLNHLTPYMFDGLNNLRTLGMRYNLISKIDPNAFYGLNSIKKIQFNTFNLTIRDYCNAIESLQTLLERRKSRQVLGIAYYDSINVENSDELNCGLSFYFLIKNIHLNTFDDQSFFCFYDSCFAINNSKALESLNKIESFKAVC